MGTSGSYEGPTGKNPLLPDDFDDNQQEQDSDENIENQPSDNSNFNQLNISPKLWTNAKSQMSRFINGSIKEINHPLSSYVKAHGGPIGASRTAISGKATTIKLGQFFSSLHEKGILKTFDDLKITYLNRPFEEIFIDLIKIIAPTPKSKEEAVANKAVFDCMQMLYDEIEKNNYETEDLDHLSPELINNVMESYISFYLLNRLFSELGYRIEKSSLNPENVIIFEKQIKTYIFGIVHNTIKETNLMQIDYNSGRAKDIIDQIFFDCYEDIEGMIS